MPNDIDVQLRSTAELVEVNLGYGDQVHRPRRLDHLSGFPSRSAALAAAGELEGLGYEIDGLRRRWLTVWLAFGKEIPVDHESAAAFTREVVGVVDRHGGTYDGWSGFLVTEDA
ncbi:ribonuclease E inhibitor RraB [Blastococcus mobilis]|uniref:Regulator of ribonuclease activity B n=1 Tax=Blastococcus mobilis TaxID=1938746 RepID=A0A238WAB3_9ACTN|nr:ribonuclease E inhibitor RraB [Blastococcus mobilis]SNR43214.1 Regulator of ribonuclease activity B [Blastococcus mobilis]